MRILIIDAPQDLYQQCTAHSASHWPGAAVDVPDDLIAAPAKTCARDGSGEWSQSDALLLNHHVEGYTGIESLRATQERAPTLPPVILLPDEAGEDVAVQAMKLGAAGYQTVLDRLLAKNPDDRFQSARELFAYIPY